jgi:tight adherence protein B
VRRSILKRLTVAVGASATLLLAFGAPVHAQEAPAADPTATTAAPATPAADASTATTAAATATTAPAPAQAGAVVREVDTRNMPTVTLTVAAPGQSAIDPSRISVTEDGEAVTGASVVRLADTPRVRGTVLLVDTSAGTEENNLIGTIRDAARAFVEAKNATDQVAIVKFGGDVVTITDFTADKDQLRTNIDTLVAGGERRLWDGITTAGRAFVQEPTLQPNVVLITTGADAASKNSGSDAAAALQLSHSAFFVAGLNYADASVQARAASTGGAWANTADPAQLPGLLRGVKAALDNQFVVSYQSKVEDGPFSIAVALGDARTSVLANPGTLAEGVQELPPVVREGQKLGVFQNDRSRMLIVILVVAAVVTFAGAIVLIFVRRDDAITDRLSIYTDEAARRAALEGDGDGSRFAESNMMKRAVEMTENLAIKHGFLEKVEAKLDQADLPLRPAEALFFYLMATVVLGLLLLVLAPSMIVGLLLAGLVAVAPIGFLKYRRTRRIRKFNEQLPDALQLLSSTLRAGYSLLQGVDAVAQESHDPMGKELQRVMVEARLGRVMEEALDDMAIRMESNDFAWAVMAIRIQREVGGNLAELLQTVGETMVLRERMRREIKALTAEGSISALVMGLLPIILGGILYMSAPDYIGTLFQHTMGLVFVGLAGLGAVIGVFWLRKLIRIDV